MDQGDQMSTYVKNRPKYAQPIFLLKFIHNFYRQKCGTNTTSAQKTITQEAYIYFPNLVTLKWIWLDLSKVGNNFIMHYNSNSKNTMKTYKHIQIPSTYTVVRICIPL
jgi:hypothetical protein